MLLPYSRHGALSPEPPHTTISQHAVQQVYTIKLENIIVLTVYLLANLRHNALLTCRACVCWFQMMETHAPNWLNQ
jgi:hypothetical protein